MARDLSRAGETPGSLHLAQEAGRLLRERGLRLGVAESCTGGLLGGRITAVAGSSEYFLGGVIVYANELKRDLLGVGSATLESHGAVSPECAAEMASGARRRLGVDVALAVTGVAGPGGGTAEKPVGLVYVGLSGPGGTLVRELRLAGSREAIREATVGAALDWLCTALGEDLSGRGAPSEPSGVPIP